MKKKIAGFLVLVLVLLTFAACGEKTVPAPVLTFETAKGGAAVKLLDFYEDVSTLEDIGAVENESGKMTLSVQCFNGSGEQVDDGYVYEVPEAYFTLRKRETVDGILIYWGMAYGVVTDGAGNLKLYTLDETLSEQPWTDFYNRALRWQKKNSELSGGTGLA